MGLFDRFKDFGDREMVKTYAMRVGVGLQQLQSASDLNMILKKKLENRVISILNEG